MYPKPTPTRCRTYQKAPTRWQLDPQQGAFRMAQFHKGKIRIHEKNGAGLELLICLKERGRRW